MRSAAVKKVLPAIRDKSRSIPLLTVVPTVPNPTARVFGYARVSTEEQSLDVQLTALKAAGADEIFVEKISAVNAKRSMFNLMLKFAERGDTILFHSLSRMGRELPKLLAVLRDLGDQGIAWRSLTEPHLDSHTPIGKLMLAFTGAMAEFERDQVIERTKRGMDECRRKGMYLGAPRKVSDATAKKMRADRKRRMTTEQLAEKYKVSAGTVNKYAPKRRRK